MQLKSDVESNTKETLFKSLFLEPSMEELPQTDENTQLDEETIRRITDQLIQSCFDANEEEISNLSEACKANSAVGINISEVLAEMNGAVAGMNVAEPSTPGVLEDLLSFDTSMNKESVPSTLLSSVSQFCASVRDSLPPQNSAGKYSPASSSDSDYESIHSPANSEESESLFDCSSFNELFPSIWD